LRRDSIAILFFRPVNLRSFYVVPLYNLKLLIADFCQRRCSVASDLFKARNMSTQTPETMFAALRRLFNRGVRYSTVIDAGCADGQFVLKLLSLGLLADGIPVNVDANSLYEGSLKAIAASVGGHYRISALTDHVGEIEITTAAHPYWASVRPAGDTYWLRLNGLSGQKVTVPATTLDALSQELALQPPFLLKLDVQGAEKDVLKGGQEVLKHTHVVICEADVDDFGNINDMLVKSGFVLYDATALQRVADGTLGWFYPIYVNKALDFVLPKSFWRAEDNDAIVRTQFERRATILKWNAEILARYQSHLQSRPQPGAPSQLATLTRRNESCPCGSGLRYKHCCGAHQGSQV
jgi:FkbM family methyltransferase